MIVDEDEEDGALFEEEVELGAESDTPPHLRDLLVAVERGSVDGLRLALGLFLTICAIILFLSLVFSVVFEVTFDYRCRNVLYLPVDFD